MAITGSQIAPGSNHDWAIRDEIRLFPIDDFIELTVREFDPSEDEPPEEAPQATANARQTALARLSCGVKPTWHSSLQAAQT